MYPDLNSQSAKNFERAKAVLPGGNSRSTIELKPHPIYLTHGLGSKVFDVDGNAYLDFINNYTSLIHGHAFPAVTEAVTKQLLGTAYSFGTVQEIEHAELICGRVPGFDKIRFCNSGSEAVMNAIKAARAFYGPAQDREMRGCISRQLRLRGSQSQYRSGKIGGRTSRFRKRTRKGHRRECSTMSSSCRITMKSRRSSLRSAMPATLRRLCMTQYRAGSE